MKRFKLAHKRYPCANFEYVFGGLIPRKINVFDYPFELWK